jgi:peptidoglycan/xylan/chitin deacetylase (PgdA/CDA1 family)
MIPLPDRLVVLMYHGLHRGGGDGGHFDARYSVTPEAFEAQMRRVRDGRGQAWLPDVEATGVASPQIMVTFDDGEASDATVALPILQGLGLRAAFFVTSGFIGRPGSVDAAQLRQLSDAGMLVGSHGASHRFLSTLSDAELRAELLQSRERLQECTGRGVDMLALPGGRGGERELAMARELGYRHVFDSTPGDNRGNLGFIERVAIVRDTALDEFEQILAWKGAAPRAIEWRHRLLRLPKRLIGDNRYLRIRQALMR